MKERTAEILCVGTELLMGNTVNTNAAFLGRELALLGLNLYHQTVVGDNPARLREALMLALSRADVVIATGGLGPTYDDLTKETIADCFGLPLELHEESLRAIRERFERMGRTCTMNNDKQALLPKGCTVLPNPNGTAPGCAIYGQGELAGKLAVMLPGPPREMQPMFTDHVAPLLRRESETRLVSRCLYFFGIGESALEQRLHDLMANGQNPTVAPYCKTGEVMLRVTARVGEGQDEEALLGPTLDAIRDQVGEYLYGVDVDSLEHALVAALGERGLTVAAAESVTGGLVAKRITDIPGSSGVFHCGVVSYSNDQKQALLGVSPDTLGEYSAVSAQTAREMAAGIRRVSGADIGVATTGNAGPDASEGKPVGLVYAAVDSPWHSRVLELRLDRGDQDQRETIREMAASHALHLALEACAKQPPSR